MASSASGYHAPFALLKGLGLLVVLTMAAQAAYAPKTDAQIFADYLKSPAYKTFLSQSFNDGEPVPLKASCGRLDIVAVDPPLVLQAPEFAQIGNTYPFSVGRWVARATLNRCGTKVIRRLFIAADPTQGTLHATEMLPGEFPGNIQLENDATRIVLPGMMAVANCRDFHKLFVLDTRLTSPAKPQGWSETWTVQACGRPVTADVIYTADATGMNITARNVKVR
jgi:hypothetical protein